jgi:16S rRNA (adenine1518-N6/adenine1519-N6)-dimethyltransferase
MTRQKLGQHFLTDPQIADREISYASVTTDDTVLEIGPGRGILTLPLAKLAKQVVAIEIDPKLCSHLQTIIPENVTLIAGDVLRVDLSTLPLFSKIIANLPFQISSPITFKLLEYPFMKAVLIYQKDFAERMVAPPGTPAYSRLSVHVFYQAHCRILETISRQCFSPAPEVDASIVELVPRKHPPFPVKDSRFFLELTKQLFLHRRKKIRTILRGIYGEVQDLPYLENRVEELSPGQIGELSDLLLLKKLRDSG